MEKQTFLFNKKKSVYEIIHSPKPVSRPNSSPLRSPASSNNSTELKDFKKTGKATIKIT
jgi:hypothetical protein